ncbi:MAG: LacI family DNA-binding transcriptional regulator [Verrucomicrobiota bacterium JB023]|nr:LacI family DNA-binding transcriptional regulator [Verrucomicrobiota bacterium JB023]
MSTTNPSSRRVTLRDIGKALGVSHSTVSLALHNHPRISEPMRKKVREAAKSMGYRPDPMLAALATYRRNRSEKPITSSLAWINAWPDAKALRSHQEFDGYWKGAYQAAKKLGYRLEEFRLDHQFNSQRLHQILSTRGIRGILLPPHQEQPVWKDFPWERYSVVRLGRSIDEPSCHVVASDEVSNAMRAYREIRRRGYQRIGFVGSASGAKDSGMIFELGFIGGQRVSNDKAKLPPLHLSDNKSETRQRMELRQWLDENQPDAIFTTQSNVPKLLELEKVRVPQDIALATTTILDTPIDSGINQHAEEIGRVAITTLNSLINDGSRGVPSVFRQILVEGSWVNGTCLPRKGSSLRDKRSDHHA